MNITDTYIFKCHKFFNSKAHIHYLFEEGGGGRLSVILVDFPIVITYNDHKLRWFDL